jgi:hypothetical protein
VTAQGSPRVLFRRAIEHKNLLNAEAGAREMGIVSLAEALDLVCLVAERAPERLDGYGRRLLVTLASERRLSLAELDLALAALRALPRTHAETTLRGLL